MIFDIIKFEEIESTNITAKNIINDLKSDSHFKIITAKSQQNGRGRYDREWVSEEGNFFTSIILKKELLPFKDTNLLPIISAIFLHDTLSEYIDNCKIKWPNDILINGKKISGVLIESIKSDNDIFYIIGIGINNTSFPKEMLYPATSLKYEGVSTSNEDILKQLMRKFSNFGNSDSFVVDKLQIINRWKEKASGIGNKIEIRQLNESINGIFKDIDNDGNLLLQKNNNEIVKISAGDIFMLD